MATDDVQYLSSQMRIAHLCKNQNKWAQQHKQSNSQNVTDAYYGRKRRFRTYDIGKQHYTTKMFPQISTHQLTLVLYNSN